MKIGSLVKYSDQGLTIHNLTGLPNHVGVIVGKHPTRDRRYDVMWISPKDVSGITDTFMNSDYLEVVSENNDQ